MEKARLALDSALAAGALRYAKKEFRQAEEAFQTGLMEMAHQKGRPAPLRRYGTADSLLNRASSLAFEASQLANDRSKKLKNEAVNEQVTLRTELENWREALDSSLVIYKAENHWSTANFKMELSGRLIQKGEYQAALEAAAGSRNSLKKLAELLTKYADENADKILLWRRWVQDTIAESQVRRSYAIIVDKSAHKAFLLRAGNKIHSYDCDLGYNSAGQKLFAGDGATPEGKYKVIAAKLNQSKFYKALLLDYPNQADRKRFRENKARGLISPHARIGANIEIHGDGGLHRDWTDGCIALTNGDMDHILNYATVGTPVTIVRYSDQWP